MLQQMEPQDLLYLLMSGELSSFAHEHSLSYIQANLLSNAQSGNVQFHQRQHNPICCVQKGRCSRAVQANATLPPVGDGAAQG